MKIRNLVFLLYISLIALLLGSCSNNQEDEPESPYVKGNYDATVLIYAIASNSLSGNLPLDKDEMLIAAEKMDLSRHNILVYQRESGKDPELLTVKKNKDGYAEFVVVKEYSNDIFSVDPKRFAEVFADMQSFSPSDEYDLILWSHGTGWVPDFNNDFETTPNEGDVIKDESAMAYSFGEDRNNNLASYSGKINIDQLADAIPSNLFKFIWIDACYMSGIETVYELRNKCKYFVGYPTEVFNDGMPYDLVLPEILKKDVTLFNLSKGAQKFFDYYSNQGDPLYRVATVCVIDMSKLESLADFCKKAFANYTKPSVAGIQKYSRGSISSMYDFGTYVSKVISETNPGVGISELNSILDNLIYYKAVTDLDFNYQPIDVENYSGINCHIYDETSDSDLENFYRKLDWFKRVY